jgi:hypothetical protein
MKKFIFASAAVAAFFFANIANVSAQSAVMAAMSSTAQLEMAVANAEPAIYTTSPTHTIEFADDECVLVVYNLDGQKIYKTMVMDGKLEVPAEMVGCINILDINSQSGHQSFEVAVREAADYSENY